jgi:hypothetical protein
MTADEFAELVRQQREAWEQRFQRGTGELPKPPGSEPLRDGSQGELW